jgi:SAM-dependent methyltransferase
VEDLQPTPFDDADLYDLLFHNFDYGIDFYLAEAGAAGGPVLDVACGTGRILLPLLRAGVDADGLDAFPAMLEGARRKAAAEGFAPALHQAEMREFRLPRRYARIFIPFNSYVHNLTQEDQIAALRTCREHLLPGGRLVFDIFYPGPDYLTQPQGEPQLEGEIAHPETGLPIRMYDTRFLEPVEQRQRSENEVRELDGNGEVLRSRRSRTEIRWIFKPEMELLLRLAGFSRWEIARAFDRTPLTGTTEPMLVTAWA